MLRFRCLTYEFDRSRLELRLIWHGWTRRIMRSDAIGYWIKGPEADADGLKRLQIP